MKSWWKWMPMAPTNQNSRPKFWMPLLLAPILCSGRGGFPAGAIRNWPKARAFLSRGGNAYARVILGMPLRDATGGFRAFRRQVLAAVPFAAALSQGYCFQVELAWRAWQAGFTVTEVPITFIERELGASKMNGQIVREALWHVTLWGLATRWSQLLGRFNLASARSILDRRLNARG
jgi:dolichol-phosphate mannosyltransferase